MAEDADGAFYKLTSVATREDARYLQGLHKRLHELIAERDNYQRRCAELMAVNDLLTNENNYLRRQLDGAETKKVING